MATFICKERKIIPTHGCTSFLVISEDELKVSKTRRCIKWLVRTLFTVNLILSLRKIDINLMLIYYQSRYFRNLVVYFQHLFQDRLHSCPWGITQLSAETWFLFLKTNPLSHLNWLYIHGSACCFLLANVSTTSPSMPCPLCPSLIFHLF